MNINRNILAQCDACYLPAKENGAFATETLVKFTLQHFSCCIHIENCSNSRATARGLLLLAVASNVSSSLNSCCV